MLTMATMEGDEAFDPKFLGSAEEVCDQRVGVNDALCAVSRTLEGNSVVPGGGAVETAVSMHLDDFARTLDSYEQWAIAEYSEALLTIPKTLALNAAQDAVDLLAALKVKHNAARNASDPKKSDYKFYGLALVKGSTRNSVE